MTPSAASTSKQGAVGHFEDALDLATEIGVAGRVDDVDLRVADFQGDVFGEDRDAAFAFEVVGVEYAGAAQLALAEQARLTEHLIDQGGLAVIDVGDDGDIAEVRTFHCAVNSMSAALWRRFFSSYSGHFEADSLL